MSLSKGLLRDKGNINHKSVDSNLYFEKHTEAYLVHNAWGFRYIKVNASNLVSHDVIQSRLIVIRIRRVHDVWVSDRDMLS